MMEYSEAAVADIAMLPFVSAIKTANQDAAFNFWDIGARSSDYAQECEIGRRYAAQLIDYISETEALSILPHIVAAMPREEMQGREIGFLTHLAASVC